MYPKQVEIDPKNLAKLTTILQGAYSDIVSEITTATDFGVANRKAILAQIEAILEETGQDLSKFLEKEMPVYYKDGAAEGIKQLKNIDAPIQIQTGFNKIHLQAINALVDDTAKAFGESLTGVSRSATQLLGKAVREQLTQKIATGQISGAALREVKLTIKGVLHEQGLDALIDKGGHTWTLDRYSEMLFRSKAVEARNRGLLNRLAENDYDLVQVSEHSGSCPICADWEGKILSITGQTDGYETVDTAEADGLFHPNCRHALNALTPSLANKTRAYDPETETLSPEEADITNI